MSGPVPQLHWHRTTLDGRVAVYGDTGEGPPLVFVHGWGLSSRTYSGALPQIARAGVRVIAPALPGFGESDELPGEYTWEKLARWMDILLEHAGIDEAAFFVGHSFGGGVATATAYHHPGRVRSLVLVNAVGGAVWKDDDEAPSHMRDRPIWEWGIRLPTDLRFDSVRSLRTMLPVIARDFVGNALRNPRALRHAANLARSADLREELKEIAAAGTPVTVLWGDQDRVIPEATFAAICDAAGTTGDIVENAGHAWLLTDPEGFGELMTNSLSVHALLERGADLQAVAEHELRDKGRDGSAA